MPPQSRSLLKFEANIAALGLPLIAKSFLTNDNEAFKVMQNLLQLMKVSDKGIL